VSRQLTLFLVATQFLTRLPMPKLAGFESSWLSQSARYFPLVGVLVGAINVAVWWLARQVLPMSVSVGIMLTVSVLLTGAFHEDGLADTCDGLAAGGPRDRILAVMKDSRIGAFGAIALVLALGLKWATLDALPAAMFPLVVIAAHMWSRFCAIALIWRLPYARSESDGKAKPFADRLSGGEWLLSGLIGLLALAPIAWLAGTRADALDPLSLAIGCASASLLAWLAAAYLRHRIGGYTGDGLGAVQQTAELAFLIGSLAALHPAARSLA
jgi:adenosylcobinamide-GDP ribazoletransferase